MKNNLKILLSTVVILTVLAGCSKTNDVPSKASSKVYVIPNNLLSKQVENMQNHYNDRFQSFINEPTETATDRNPLTGLKTATEERAMVFQLDNFASARPQAGLEDADIVYEMLAEGNITRYMAVFYSKYPSVVGPVRSTRPYFVERAIEFDPFYVHVGGSMQGLTRVIQLKIADIDGISSSAFYRVSHKKIPHNLYTTAELILKDAEKRGFEMHSEPQFLDFNTTFDASIGVNAQTIRFVYRKPTKNDTIGYSSSYKYNSEEKRYYRYTNNKAHLDENSKNPIVCENILVQDVSTKVVDDAGRLEIQFIGSGTGRLYTGGKCVEVVWKKEDATKQTLFYYEDGTPIKLNPGKTWVQVMTIGNREIIE